MQCLGHSGTKKRGRGGLSFGVYQQFTLKRAPTFYLLNLATPLPALGTPPRLAAVPTEAGAPRAAQARAQPGNAATKGAREAESFHMPDQWGRAARTARQPHKGASAAPAGH